jgi:hypothetical protein
MNAAEVMVEPQPRFVLTPAALADRHVGLAWEPRPSEALLTWAEALASATAAGWRLPTVAELLSLFEGLRIQTIWTPNTPMTLWSASGSPFAPASRVRVVHWERSGRLAVGLVDRAESAHRWGVRTELRRLNVVQPG